MDLYRLGAHYLFHLVLKEQYISIWLLYDLLVSSYPYPNISHPHMKFISLQLFHKCLKPFSWTQSYYLRLGATQSGFPYSWHFTNAWLHLQLQRNLRSQTAWMERTGQCLVCRHFQNYPLEPHCLHPGRPLRQSPQFQLQQWSEKTEEQTHRQWHALCRPCQRWHHR